MTGEHGYEEGLRDGKIAHLEQTIDTMGVTLSSHEKRLIYLERIAASMLAILAFTTFVPRIVEFFERVGS